MPELTVMQRVMKNHVARPLASNPVVHGVVVGVFVVAAVFLGIGIRNMQQGLPLLDIAPSGHYARDYLQQADRYAVEAHVGEPGEVVTCVLRSICGAGFGSGTSTPTCSWCSCTLTRFTAAVSTHCRGAFTCACIAGELELGA